VINTADTVSDHFASTPQESGEQKVVWKLAWGRNGTLLKITCFHFLIE
jgi:hypothetical protein